MKNKQGKRKPASQATLLSTKQLSAITGSGVPGITSNFTLPPNHNATMVTAQRATATMKSRRL